MNRRGARGPELASSAVGYLNFRPASDLVQKLVEKRRAFKCIILVTYACEPGRDSFRAAAGMAGQLAEGTGPVAFVCHEQPYLEYLNTEADAETLPALLLRALAKEKPVDEAFCGPATASFNWRAKPDSHSACPVCIRLSEMRWPAHR